MAKVKPMLILGALSTGFLVLGCQGHQADKPTDSSTSAASTASTTTSPAQKSEDAFKDFTPPIDPCVLVDASQLNNQGTAPIKAKKLSDGGSHVLSCTYDDASYNTVLDVSLTGNPDGVSNYRDYKLRVLQSEGVDIYVMVDEPGKCSVGLLGPNDDLAAFKFSPDDAAVSAAGLPAGQTWCDFSAPVIAQASKKLGWTK